MSGTKISNLWGKITILFVIWSFCLPVQAKYGGGSGTEEDPYQIYTAEQMNAIGADSNDWDKHFKLMADIDLSTFTGTSFNIIGTASIVCDSWGCYPLSTPFTGAFDGNGYIIFNFTYNSTDRSYTGLFGYIDDPNAEIKNLRLIDPNVDAGTGKNVGSLVGYFGYGAINDCYVDCGSVSGNWYVGGLVGYGYRGTITNCSSTSNANGKDNVGGLVGFNWEGPITNCCSTGNVTGTHYFTGGLVGYNSIGKIIACYSTVDVSGNFLVGGLVGSNHEGAITNCYSKGIVSGSLTIGGLVGGNHEGPITNCSSTSFVEGYDSIGGLVGSIHEGPITNCYSTGSVSGNMGIGGLVGRNHNGLITSCSSTSFVEGYDSIGGLVGSIHEGSITNCYSNGSVMGDWHVGGLVGDNFRGTITNSYSTGRVSGSYYVGGLVGRNYAKVISSFWDIETSGQNWSAGGTGLPTDQMQTMSTFTNAGWDFVGEIVNGTEDIWWILEGDYPRLWWEGMQVPMKLTPRTLNCRSKGNWIKAHIILPEGFTVEDVDSDRPAVLHSFGFQSAPLYVFVNEDERVQIVAAFEREALCSLTGNWPQTLTVAGFLSDGNIFLGTSMVRIIHPGMKMIEELAWYWLNTDCVQPDLCNDIDMNRDSLVNLLDYALLLNSKVEFIRE